MPPPGAVCPAMVVFARFKFNCAYKRMVPDTLNTIILLGTEGLLLVTAYLNVPGVFAEDELSTKEVTSKTFGAVETFPRPPETNFPAPSAPGNDNNCASIALAPEKKMTIIKNKRLIDMYIIDIFRLY